MGRFDWYNEKKGYYDCGLTSANIKLALDRYRFKSCRQERDKVFVCNGFRWCRYAGIGEVVLYKDQNNWLGGDEYYYDYIKVISCKVDKHDISDVTIEQGYFHARTHDSNGKGYTKRTIQKCMYNNELISDAEANKVRASAKNKEGNKKYDEEDYQGAINDYNEAIRLNSDEGVFYSNKADALNHLKRYDEAIEEADKALKLDKNCLNAKIEKAFALNARGNIKFKDKNYLDALNDFEQAIQCGLSEEGYYNNKAAVLIKLSRYKDAINVAEQALKIDPNYQLAKEKILEAEALELEKEANSLTGQTKLNKLKNAIDKLQSLMNSHTKQEQEYIDKQRTIKQSIKEEVVNDFNQIIERPLADSIASLIENNIWLDRLVDWGFNEPAVVNRMLIAEMRIARNELQQSLSSDDTRRLRVAIQNFLRDEIKILDSLNIQGGGVRTELNNLQARLTNIRPTAPRERVELVNIAQRLVNTEARVVNLNQVRESLAQQTQYEVGRSLVLRDSLIGYAFEAYYIDGMNTLLSLRIENQELQEKINILPSMMIGNNIAFKDLDNALELLVRENQANIIILPILIPSIQDNSIMHWVGIIGERMKGGMQVSYFDSENQQISTELKNLLISVFSKVYDRNEILLTQVEVEQQCYNNCGPELIENFIYYLTGDRVTQEAAIYLHSLLYENSLLDPGISASQIAENNLMIQYLSHQDISMYKMIGVKDDRANDIDANSQVTTIPGSNSNNIFLQSNEGRMVLISALQLYGLRAFGEMVELGEDEEVANTILDQVQEQGIVTILDAFFEDTTETAISKFETIIIVEDNRNQVGLYQYFWDALSNNYLTRSAQNLIQEVNYLYTQVQSLIEEGQDYGNKFLILSSSLEFLLDFAESGQKLPIFRPPYHPDDHGDHGDHGGSGGSGGGSYFEGGGNNMNNDGGDIFLNSLNISVYYAGINNSLDNEI
jgi:tetratricopeptide (TPR) repeat protein